MRDWYQALVAELQIDPLAAALLMCPARTGGKKRAAMWTEIKSRQPTNSPQGKPNPPVYLLNAVQSSPNKPRKGRAARNETLWRFSFLAAGKQVAASRDMYRQEW